MQQPVTPYLWNYEPQSGHVSGATQDYGAVINWLSADPRMFARVRNVNNTRNFLDKYRANVTRHDFAANFNNWPAEQVTHRKSLPYVPANDTSQSYNVINDFMSTADGAQIAGGQQTAMSGKGYALGDGRRYRKLTRDALPFPYNWQVSEDGKWRNIRGRGCNALSSY